ncbi:D-alanyl-D-alanine carboxypeptidase [Actinomadura sp. DC4]|uniref:D-alanyl-D-alanine carboxypeptidase family protein n=1 Tax=Actinomadura sp. DC4 TaxID=3055069 RepID=UPI0025AF761A|nr:D-alanyl-D-alanine carboxypeptidase [Actinomadura sp. DC4]MDN3352240.1 D-alanyl-D-alanine carboxypeptidase [Actinomadura sp. DC4]
MTGIAERMALPPAKETGGPTRHTGRIVAIICAVAGVLLLALVAAQMLRPLPSARLRLVTAASHTVPGTLSLPWPSVGQAVVEVDGLGRMGSSGSLQPTPTASVAKVMTAYVFLKDHPLPSGQEGPTYRVSPEEAARLPWRIAREETHVDVVANQPFTEREALEALMIVSANNIAHEIARWDSGGDVPFVAKMNAMARRLGMTATRYTDPSGFDATTVSTAADQVRLFRAAMRIPAFTEVVSKSTFTPRTGGQTRSGGNTLLGSYGVIGGKTGFTSQAGANYVFAARSAGKLLVGAVMAQPQASSPAVAVSAAQPLIQAAENSLTRVTLAPRGATVARVDDGFGHRVRLAAATPVTVIGWPGLTLRLHVEGTVPRHAPAGAAIASVTTGGDRIHLRLARPLRAPTLLDRLTRRA